LASTLAAVVEDDDAGADEYFASLDVPMANIAVWVSIPVHLLTGSAIPVCYKTRWAAPSGPLFVPAKHVTDTGSYSEDAQCSMCSQSFTDPQYILSQDMQLLHSSGLVPKD
jgi:hypothetical protein